MARATSLKMLSALETAMSSIALLSVILIQGVFGTYFPPVSNPPPIPGQGIRAVNAQPQQIYIQEDFTSEVQQPEGNDGFFQREAKPDEPRWYIRESQSGESVDFQGSLESFDRFYPEGEPAIGPVATPMPDDTYEAEPTSISRVKPNDAINSGTPDIWVLTRGPDNQITPERWVQIQVPSDRVVEVVNQEPGPVLATDTVKSFAAPAPLTGPVKSQVISGKSPNIVQQVWVQAPDISAPQKGYASPTAIVEEVPSIKQIVQIPTANAELLTPQVTKNAYPLPPPPPPAVISKTSFAAPPAVISSDVVSKSSFVAPPPPPPPLKGGEVPPKVISSSPIGFVPSNNFLTSGKSGLMQQVRHIWIPTSARTGKFISLPVSSALSSGKSVVSKGSPLEPQPIAVSDTWVLKQNGPVPSFEEQKSVISPPIVNNKVIIQDPPVLRIDTIPAPPVFTEIASPKNVPVVDKGNPTIQVDIWPPRNDIKTKIYEKSAGVVPSNIPPQPLPKTDSVVLSKSVPFPPPLSQKSVFTSPKAAPLPLPIPAPAVQIINGKPCPVPLPSPQKSLFPSSPKQFYSPSRIIATQNKTPLTRIIRVNRYPTGSYYLLNSKVRPNFFNYPRPAFISQARPQLIRLVQNKQVPFQLKNVVSFPPVQTRQIPTPLKTKGIPAPVPARQVVFPFSGRQIILPISQLKSQNRLIYPGVQNIRYAYPWNPYIKASPVPGKRVVLPPSNPIKKIAPITKISSSSSESSSSGSSSESSESSEEEKKEVKSEEEEKPQSEESSESGEKESEKEESESKSSESKEEEASESQSKENIETAESQAIAAHENLPILSNREDLVRSVSPRYIFRYDNRDRNGTMQQRQETSNGEGRVTGTYSYIDPTGLYRRANYIADSDGFRVKLESNEPGTISHESANANFISNQVTAEEGIQRYETVESTHGYSTTGTQRD